MLAECSPLILLVFSAQRHDSFLHVALTRKMGLFSSSSAPQPFCKVWLSKSRPTNYLYPGLMPAGVLNKIIFFLCDFEKSKKPHPIPWTYSTTEPCPGVWTTLGADGKHTISLNFTGYYWICRKLTVWFCGIVLVSRSQTVLITQVLSLITLFNFIFLNPSHSLHIQVLKALASVILLSLNSSQTSPFFLLYIYLRFSQFFKKMILFESVYTFITFAITFNKNLCFFPPLSFYQKASENERKCSFLRVSCPPDITSAHMLYLHLMPGCGTQHGFNNINNRSRAGLP